MRKSKSSPLGGTKSPTADRDPDDTGAPHRRDRHGFRGVPPVPTNFSLASLADDALLTEVEVAAVLRVSTNTLGGWRQQPNHALQWLTLPNGFVRYEASAIRAFLALGRSRTRRSRADRAVINPPKPRDRPKGTRGSSRRRADVAATTKPEAASVP
jgi:hypothetical protein